MNLLKVNAICLDTKWRGPGKFIIILRERWLETRRLLIVINSYLLPTKAHH